VRLKPVLLAFSAAIVLTSIIPVVPAQEEIGQEVTETVDVLPRPRFAWYRLTIPFGITTFSLLVLTLLAGWFMRINRKLLFKWHRRLAITTLVAALCHLLVVILSRS